MSYKRFASNALWCARVGLTSLALFQFSIGAALTNAAPAQTTPKTKTPIKHVIVIIGENRSFDHVFATYKPKNGQTVMNLLSEGIINKDGTPGPNFAKAQQFAGVDQGSSTTPTDPFLLNPAKSEFP